jgi:hypothetical protein
VLRLRISRTVVVLEGPDRTLESTPAVVALTVERGRVGICSVGETDEQLRERLTRELDAVGRNPLAARLAREAEHRARGSVPRAPRMQLVRPGEDPWWDRRIVDPYALRSGEHRRSHDPREIFIVHPLAEDTWSPHLIRGLLVYVFWASPWTRMRTWPPFLRPHVELVIADDIAGVDRAELVDTIRALWGGSRVRLPPGQAVGPLPLTRLRVSYVVSRALWWAAAVTMLVAAHPEPGPPAVVAGVIAAAALFTSRVLRARLEADRPRRSDAQTPMAPR